MSIDFHCNQYENAFCTLKNWEVKKGVSQYPCSRDGFTQIIATDRGHLVSGVPRSRRSPWGQFVGTWDMPNKIPGNSMTNTTARSELAIEKLERMKTDGDIIIKGHLKRSKVPPALKVRGDPDTVKPPTPKSASGRLAGAGEPTGEPQMESRMRSGAKNPTPAGKPSSVDWPRPGGSRLEKPMSPVTFPLANGYPQLAPAPVATPPSRGGRPEPYTPPAVAAPHSPDPELQGLHCETDPVNWPMPN